MSKRRQVRRGAETTMTKPIKGKDSKIRKTGTEKSKDSEKHQPHSQKQGKRMSQMMYSPSGAIS